MKKQYFLKYSHHCNEKNAKRQKQYYSFTAFSYIPFIGKKKTSEIIGNNPTAGKRYARQGKGRKVKNFKS